MKPQLQPLLKLLLAAGASALVLVAVVVVWLDFPRLMPTPVLVVVGILAASVCLLSQLLAVLSLVRRGQGRLHPKAGTEGPPLRAILILVVFLLLINGALIELTWPHPNSGMILVANAGSLAGWFVARRALGRRWGERNEPPENRR
jgi:hypothetical protein